MTADRTDVLVVGAGISGLVAADAVHRSGRSVRVLESRDRVGGRMRSMSTDAGVIDLGATWFWGNEPGVIALADRLGAASFTQFGAGDAMFEPGPRRIAGVPGVGDASRFTDGAQDLAARLAAQLPRGTRSSPCLRRWWPRRSPSSRACRQRWPEPPPARRCGWGRWPRRSPSTPSRSGASRGCPGS
ncbi:MAG TPA: FAD-dependent oxidoreductase [Candidatus Dietzia intestinipullorum]|nr:FAD-dependent oxidoreductase [Candidatus Dietzia intestinipullorum]